jgi:hypothetical protein
MTEREQMEKLIQMVISLDSGVDQLGSLYVSLSQDIDNSGNAQGLSNQMLEHKVNLIRRTLGSKPEYLKSKIEAPTVWGAMATILEGFETTPEELPNLPKRGPSPVPEEWTKRMATMDDDLMATASALSKAIQAQGHRIDTFQNKSEEPPALGRSVDSLSTVSLKEEMKGMRAEMLRLNAESKPHVVKFAGLHLDSRAKARAWISSNVASEDIGLVVDSHTVFQHIHANVLGGEFLNDFERVHKLNISTLAQGYSISSFEQAIPKFLSTGGSVVIKDDSSYLSKISNWSDWDYPGTSLRQTLMPQR